MANDLLLDSDEFWDLKDILRAGSYLSEMFPDLKTTLTDVMTRDWRKYYAALSESELQPLIDRKNMSLSDYIEHREEYISALPSGIEVSLSYHYTDITHTLVRMDPNDETPMPQTFSKQLKWEPFEYFSAESVKVLHPSVVKALTCMLIFKFNFDELRIESDLDPPIDSLLVVLKKMGLRPMDKFGKSGCIWIRSVNAPYVRQAVFLLGISGLSITSPQYYDEITSTIHDDERIIEASYQINDACTTQ